MSRVSITGARATLQPVVETIHDLDLVHLLDYDGEWEGFDNGDPMAGNETTAERRVTVRALMSLLDVDRDADIRPRTIDADAIAERLPDLRKRVNDLDDERSELADELSDVESRLDGARPFSSLGVDLDLLRGYDSLQVAVGKGDPEAVEAAVAESYDRYETIAGDGVTAVFVPQAATDPAEALVGVDFATLEVPDVEGEISPADYIADLERRWEELDSKRETVESKLDDVRHEARGFLLAAEEELSIRVQKAEAPLQFATTERAFVAEGWVPTPGVDRLRTALSAAVGDRVEVDEIERADYDGHHEYGAGHGDDEHAAAADGAEDTGAAAPAATDGGTPAAVGGSDEGDSTAAGAQSDDEPALADGGTAMGGAGEPPVVQKNPGPVKPFEALVEVINRPQYDEFDPSVVLFLTFPAFFGFMIGDLGYGILYMLIGYLLYDRTEGTTLQSLGGIAMWAGGFTALFGVLYGEFFGLHQLGELVWDGKPPMHKGLQPAFLPYAQAWLVLSLLAGILHLTVGYAFDFVERLGHGLRDAVTESASWILLMNGVWVWILSGHAAGSKPGFLFNVFAGGEGAAFELGFAGFSAGVGQGALAVAALGFVLLLVGEGGIGLLESLNVLVNVLSYTRIAAVLLAKAGMAFVVNLLFFGAYQHHGEFHFLIDHGPSYATAEYGAEALLFPGLMHGGIAALLGGILVLVIGHALVLALGITSAGLQAVRLEYVEFFGKFYEGGGDAYEPFGHERTVTAAD